MNLWKPEHLAALHDRNSLRLNECHRETTPAADLTRSDEFDAAFGRMRDEFGGLDSVVNVAGLKRRAPVPQLNADEWDRMLDAKSGSMFLTARFSLPLLERGKGPTIVNLDSISGHVVSPDCPPAS